MNICTSIISGFRALFAQVGAVLALQRNSKVKAKHITKTNSATMQGVIGRNVECGTQIHTDDHRAYVGLDKSFGHDAAKHSADEYFRSMAHTNGIKLVWAILKRGYVGTYHDFSVKHLQCYVNEFAFRLNEGNVKNHMLGRLAALCDLTIGKTTIYKKSQHRGALYE